MSVLFTDIVGSTELRAELAPEAVGRDRPYTAPMDQPEVDDARAHDSGAVSASGRRARFRGSVAVVVVVAVLLVGLGTAFKDCVNDYMRTIGVWSADVGSKYRYNSCK